MPLTSPLPRTIETEVRMAMFADTSIFGCTDVEALVMPQIVSQRVVRT